MDGQCLRSYIKVTLGGLKKHLNSMKIKTKYNENSHKRYFLEVDVQYLENLHNLHSDLPFFEKIEKVEKLIGNLHDKEEYVMHIRNLKTALNHGLVLKNVRRVINFN